MLEGPKKDKTTDFSDRRVLECEPTNKAYVQFKAIFWNHRDSLRKNNFDKQLCRETFQFHIGSEKTELL